MVQGPCSKPHSLAMATGVTVRVDHAMHVGCGRFCDSMQIRLRRRGLQVAEQWLLGVILPMDGISITIALLVARNRAPYAPQRLDYRQKLVLEHLTVATNFECLVRRIYRVIHVAALMAGLEPQPK